MVDTGEVAMRRKAKTLKGMTQAGYGRRIDVTRQMVSQYVELGMPTLPGGRIDPKAADTWRAANIDTHTDESFADARRRKESALASLRELELRKASGDLVLVETVKSTLTDIFTQHRDALLTVPERLSAVLALETDPAKVNDTLASEIRAHLEGLADALEK